MVVGGIIGLANAPYDLGVTIILGKLLPVEKLASSFAKMALAAGLGSIVGPTVAGFIYDYTKSFKEVIFMAAVSYAIAGIALCFSAYIHYKQKITMEKEAL